MQFSETLSDPGCETHELVKLMGWARQFLVALTLHALAEKLAVATNSFCFLACALFRWLLKIAAKLQFPEDTFALHLFLQRAQGLFDIIVANDDLYDCSIS